jgi:hypothetical protein
MTEPALDPLPLIALHPAFVPMRTETLAASDIPAAPVRPGLRDLIEQRRLLAEEKLRVEKVSPATWPERTDLKARRAERELKPILTDRRLFGRTPKPVRESVELDRLDA